MRRSLELARGLVPRRVLVLAQVSPPVTERALGPGWGRERALGRGPGSGQGRGREPEREPGRGLGPRQEQELGWGRSQETRLVTVVRARATPMASALAAEWGTAKT